MSRENITELATQFVALPSTAGEVAHFEKMAEISSVFLGEAASFQHFSCNGIPSYLWTNVPGAREFDLVLTGHLDVVGAESEMAFQPRIEGSRLYGRGSADMKGSCAAMLCAFKKLITSENSKLRLGLLFTCDEESGGDSGARYICEEVGLKSKVVFLPDGGKWGELCVLQKGAMHIELNAKGISAHGARPWLGTSALEILLGDIEKLKTKLLIDGQQEEWGRTINIGKLLAGESINSVPTQAKALIDIRYGSDDSLESIRELLNQCTLASKLRELFVSQVVHVDASNTYFQLFQDVMRTFELPAATMKEHGGSDACFYGQNCETVLMTLPHCSSFHIENEWVDLDSLAIMDNVIVSFASRLMHHL